MFVSAAALLNNQMRGLLQLKSLKSTFSGTLGVTARTTNSWLEARIRDVTTEDVDYIPVHCTKLVDGVGDVPLFYIAHVRYCYSINIKKAKADSLYLMPAVPVPIHATMQLARKHISCYYYNVSGECTEFDRSEKYIVL